jgi:hypothetical protein
LFFQIPTVLASCLATSFLLGLAEHILRLRAAAAVLSFSGFHDNRRGPRDYCFLQHISLLTSRTYETSASGGDALCLLFKVYDNQKKLVGLLYPAAYLIFGPAELKTHLRTPAANSFFFEPRTLRQGCQLCYHQQYLSSGTKQARCAIASGVALFFQVIMVDSNQGELVCMSAMLHYTSPGARRILERRQRVFSILRASRNTQSQARAIPYWQNRLCRRHLHLDWHGSPVSELNTKHSLSGVMML